MLVYLSKPRCSSRPAAVQSAGGALSSSPMSTIAAADAWAQFLDGASLTQGLPFIASTDRSQFAASADVRR